MKPTLKHEHLVATLACSLAMVMIATLAFTTTIVSAQSVAFTSSPLAAMPSGLEV